jgi:hypothetical protein
LTNNIPTRSTLPSLPVHAYLLAYNFRSRAPYDRTRTAFLAQAAALTELALRGVIADDGGAPHVVGDGGAAADPVLEDLVHQISAHRRSWNAWSRLGYKASLHVLEESLQSASVILTSPGRIGRRGRVVVTNPSEALAIQGAVRALLCDAVPPESLTPGDATLGLLAVRGSMSHVVTRRQAHAASQRLDEFARCVDAAARAPVSDMIRQLHGPMIAAQGGIGGS